MKPTPIRAVSSAARFLPFAVRAGLGLWLAGMGVAGAAQGAMAPRPNILFIVTDDQGPWAFGASGESQAVTPVLDRLAREGARFTRAFTPTPVCSPARVSILTARYGSEVGITDHLNPRVDGDFVLDPALPTWPRQLQRAGYATALIGKWHLGLRRSPTEYGYDAFIGFRAGGIAPRHPALEKNGVTVKREGFVVDLLTDETIEWLEARDPAKPFAVSLHYREPHAPYLPVRDEDLAAVAGLEIRPPEPDFPGLNTELVQRLMREYLASVAAIDRNLQRLLAAMERLGLARNTVVIFTSDHGYNLGHHGLRFKGNAQWGLLHPSAVPPGTPNVPANQRPNMFDTSLRVPLVVRWPGVVAPGRVIDESVSHLDWFRTLAEIAGAPLPADATVRGRSFVPLLRGPVAGWDNDVYAEYAMKHGATAHLRAYRSNDWKLVRDFANPGRDELYHLAADPGEKRNLIGDRRPEVRAVRDRLDGLIRARMNALGDPIRYRPPVDLE
jgi:choline-sulfatase